MKQSSSGPVRIDDDGGTCCPTARKRRDRRGVHQEHHQPVLQGDPHRRRCRRQETQRQCRALYADHGRQRSPSRPSWSSDAIAAKPDAIVFDPVDRCRDGAGGGKDQCRRNPGDRHHRPQPRAASLFPTCCRTTISSGCRPGASHQGDGRQGQCRDPRRHSRAHHHGRAQPGLQRRHQGEPAT